MTVRLFNWLWRWVLQVFGPCPRVFVSYRRHDNEPVAGRIRDRLVAALGVANIFYDVHTLSPGEDFQVGIDAALVRSHLLVAILGPKWLETLREREVAGQTDWVRYEVQRAYQQRVKVVPVRVDGAPMPSAADLPDELRALASAHAVEVRGGEHFDADVGVLIEAVRKGVGLSGIPSGVSGRFWDQGPGRLRGLVAAAVALGVLGLLVWWREGGTQPDTDQQALGPLLYDTCWVTYDPAGMSLDERRQPVFPAESALAADLDQIRAVGFNGVVTSTSNGGMDRVPRLAQERGLRVIMGVWNPADPWEVSRAIRQGSHVDAYCVGHEGYPDRYSLAQLERAVALIKRRTRKPAAPSELANRYTPELARIGDWLFLDTHLTIRDADEDFRVDVDRDLDRFMAATRRVVPYAQELRRPLVFTNVAYPHSGLQGASRQRQAEFYRRLLERVNDPQRGHSVKVAIVPQSAFDTPWKVGKPFYPWDPYAGLIEPDPQAQDRRVAPSGEWDGPLSPAGLAIRKWFPLLDKSQPRAD